MKSIGVFCSSRDEISPIIKEECRLLGEALAKANFKVVYGGARTGAMGQLAEGALRAGGHVLGIFPNEDLGHEESHDELSEFISVPGMPERKTLMLEKSDGFLVFPGGIGTLDEFYEILVLKQIHAQSPLEHKNVHKKPIVLVNTLGYWDATLEALSIMESQGFIDPIVRDLFQVLEATEEVISYLQKNL